MSEDVWKLLLHFQVQIKHMTWQTCLIHLCPFKHAAGGVICQGASMIPTSSFHWCSFNLFSKRSCLHTACLLICVLPAAFKKFCSNKRWPVTGTSLARTATHLEQTWAIERLLPGLHAQKKQCFVLDSWWIIKRTTEHCATRANSKMRPEALLMHHDLRFCCFLTDMRGLCKVGLRLKEGRALKASESSHHKNHWSCSVHQTCL